MSRTSFVGAEQNKRSRNRLKGDLVYPFFFFVTDQTTCAPPILLFLKVQIEIVPTLNNRQTEKTHRQTDRKNTQTEKTHRQADMQRQTDRLTDRNRQTGRDR